MRAPLGREVHFCPRDPRRSLLGAFAAAIAVLVLFQAGAARAEGDTRGVPVAASVVSGGAIAFGSLAVGAIELGLHDAVAGRRLGAYTLLYGLALAPIVSHALALEWDRAALFAVAPFLAALTATFVIEGSPEVLLEGDLNKRRVVTVCYAVALLGAAFGIYDSMHASERAREHGFALAPIVARDRIGLALGGRL